MIDVVGAIVLTALAITTAGALIVSAPLDRLHAARWLTVAGLWLAAVAVLAGVGIFARIGVVAIGASILLPLVALTVAASRVESLRAIVFGTPLAVLVALHVGRLLGGFFLALHADGRLPATFARGAGWGDIAVAVLAIPVAWMIVRRAPLWRPVTLIWNVVAFVDLVTAVTLGIGSAPDSPVRFIHEDAIPGTLATLPWLLIPGFLVPLYLLAHLAIFTRVAVWYRAPRFA